MTVGSGNGWVLALIASVAVVAVVLLVIRSRRNKERARAYESVAATV